MITHFQRIIHRHGRWIFLILLGFILVAFIHWDYAGYASASSRGPAPTGGTVYGKKVNARELDYAKRRFVLNFLLMTGQNIPANEMMDARVEEQVLNQMALIEKARRMGITVTDEELFRDFQQFIKQMRQHSFKDAENDEEVYRRFVSEVLGPRRLNAKDLEILIAVINRPAWLAVQQ
jgi:parvulin-like peptidyl-prolyl isomerase